MVNIKENEFTYMWNFPGGPVVKTLCFHCRDTGSIPDWGTKISTCQIAGLKQNKTKRSFLGGPVVKILCIPMHRGAGSIPGWGTKILYAMPRK